MFFDARGQIEQLRLGVTTSDAFICATNRDSAKSGSSPRSGAAVRLEATLKLRGTPLDQLPTVNNPFRGLTIARLPVKSSGSDTWRFFLDCCCRRGVVAALARIKDTKLRGKFRKRLSDGLSVGWWHPADVWTSFPQALASLGFRAGHSVCQNVPIEASVDVADDDDDEDW